MGIGMRELLVILLVVLVVFGTKKLRTIGTDLGAAVRGFKKGMEESDGEQPKQLKSDEPDADFAETRTAADSKSEKKA